MSVSVAAAGRDPREIMRGHEEFGLVELSIEDLEAAGQVLVPRPMEDDPHHAEVIGDKRTAKRELAKACRWVIPPPGQSPT